MAVSSDFTARLMDDIDPVLLDFIRHKVNSFVKWDLVRLFYDNPNTADSAENIARYAGRSVEAVQSELEEMVESGLMEKRMLGQTPVYILSQNPEMLKLIGRFIVACEDRHFRVKAVYHIIKNMR